jgi:hypothetical protein
MGRVGGSVPVVGKLPQVALGVRPESLSVFRALVSDGEINALVGKCGREFRKRLYSPLLVFWAMIAQCLHGDHSCSNAVAQVLEWWCSRKAPGQRRNKAVGAPSPDTGSYCRARARLPAGLLPTIARRVGARLLDEVRAAEKIWGRDVFLVDGTTVSMPDTPELVEHFGKGSGGVKRTPHAFPLARVVALISLTTGAVVDAAVGAYKTSEHALFHGLWPSALKRNAVVVGDSLYGSYAALAVLVQGGLDLISRPYGRRDFDMRQGRRLGPGDRLVVWKRNKKAWPPWLAPDTTLPDTLTLRLVEVNTLRRGHRPKRVVLVTTLLDPLLYSADDIANLYLRRWEIEIDLRHLKAVMGMDVLRGKTPDIVHKEIWAFLATYNLIRTVMWQTGVRHDIPPCGTEFQRDAPTAEYLARAHRQRPLFTRGNPDGLGSDA